PARCAGRGADPDASSVAPPPRVPPRRRLRGVRAARARRAPQGGLAAVLVPRDVARGGDAKAAGRRIPRARASGGRTRTRRRARPGARADGAQGRAVPDAAAAPVPRAAAAPRSARASRRGCADMARGAPGALVRRRRSDRRLARLRRRRLPSRAVPVTTRTRLFRVRTAQLGARSRSRRASSIRARRPDFQEEPMARRSRPRSSSGWPYLAVGLALGLAVAAGVYFSDLRSGLGVPTTQRAAPKAERAAPPADAAASPAGRRAEPSGRGSAAGNAAGTSATARSTAPSYEFYDVLPRYEVVVPEGRAGERPARREAAEPPPVSEPGRYVLQ